MIDADDILEHYGVKGMHWGVRRDRLKKAVNSRRKTAKEKRTIAKRRKIVQKRRTLSDSDLKKLVERLQTEKKLKELTEADLAPGRAAAKKILSESGQKVAKTVLTGAIIVGGEHLLAKKLAKKKGIKLEPMDATKLKSIADTVMRGKKKDK